MEMISLFGGMVLLGMVFAIIIFVLAILVFVFWLSMLIDCMKRKFKESSDKIAWILVIIFTGIIGALIYYFVIKNKDKRK